jgi:hypothetical protein
MGVGRTSVQLATVMIASLPDLIAALKYRRNDLAHRNRHVATRPPAIITQQPHFDAALSVMERNDAGDGAVEFVLQLRSAGIETIRRIGGINRLNATPS